MQLENYTSDFIDRKERFKLKLLFIWLAPLIPSLILFIANAVDPNTFANHKWINQLLFWIFTPIILWSLFAAQKNNLVGFSGETIILLIPTFIWLLPGHEPALRLMISLGFGIILIVAALYFGSLGFRFYKIKNIKVSKILAHIFIRFAFVFASVVSTLVISIILIHWADHSMKFGYTYDNNGGVILDTNSLPLKDFASASYITFIAVTTIIVAILIVNLGLLKSFNKHFKRQNNISATQAIFSKIRPKTKSFLEKTQIIKLSKRLKKKK